MDKPVTVRELLESQIQMRWEAHLLQHSAIAMALVEAAECLDEKIELRWGAHEQQHTSLDRAREQSFIAIQVRLDAMNEFRQQLSDQAATFVTRETVSDREEAHQVMHEHTRGRISELEQWRAVVDTKFWALGIGFTIFTFAVNVITRYLFPGVPVPLH